MIPPDDRLNHAYQYICCQSINLKPVLEWCEFKFNRNSSKTYCMFVTNKRVKQQNEITVK